MTHDHWRDYHTRWARLGPPLRPVVDVASRVRTEIGDKSEPVLLLGVTPELADVAEDVTAVDRSEAMIGAIWPGDTGARRAVRGDWRALPFEDGRFGAAVGDGSFNAIVYADYERMCAELGRVLRPRGRVVVRAFLRPAACESVASVVEETLAGRVPSFHTFKWRLAMARVAELGVPDIAVGEILATFEARFPDRAELARASGFAAADIDTNDVYRGSGEVYSFPSEVEILSKIDALLGGARLAPTVGYPLAERCPLVVAERPR